MVTSEEVSLYAATAWQTYWTPHGSAYWNPEVQVTLEQRFHEQVKFLHANPGTRSTESLLPNAESVILALAQSHIKISPGNVYLATDIDQIP